MERRQTTGLNVDGTAAAFNPLEAQPRRPDWERSREERRREGHEASTVRNREGFLDQPMLGAIPNMLTDQNVLSHARNAAPMQTEAGRLGALAAQRLLMD